MKHVVSKTSKTGSVPPFSKMAAAALLQMFDMLYVSHLSPDFDEIWYTDLIIHAESMKRKWNFRKCAAFLKDGRRPHVKIIDML
jgi:hypothetical protein